MIRWIRREAWIDLLELALVAVLGVGLAHWTWLTMSPRAVAAPSSLADAARPGQGASASRHLFGVAQIGPETGRRISGPSLVLVGVLSGPGPNEGRAILAGSGRPTIVSAGETIADGIKLAEVHADHVIVVRRGVPERIELDRGRRQAVPLLAPAPVPAPR